MEEFIIENETLIKYIGNNANVIIPEGVKIIGKDSIDLNKTRSLTIPKSAKRIEHLGDFYYKYDSNRKPVEKVYDQKSTLDLTVFYNCNLSDYFHIENESVYLFNYYTKVMIKKRGKFISLQKLKEIKIPDNIRYLEDSLCYCRLKKVILGKNVKSLFLSFYMCEHLKEVVFNNVLEHIDECAFSDCTSLGPEIRLPMSVKTLGNNCFRNCKKLTTIYANHKIKIDEYNPFEEIEHPIKIVDLETKTEILLNE
jgi:hypothetical protein